MGGSASFDPSGATDLAVAASTFVACLYDRESGEYTTLPHVRVLSYRAAEGAQPAEARFEYVFDSSDPSGDSGYPADIADVFGIAAQSEYAVNEDSEIVIFETTADGDQFLVFDGFAETPQADLGGGNACSFTAAHVSKRLWDNVIEGATYRDADKPDDGDEVETDLPTVFNPWNPTLRECRPNCTPDDHDVNQGDDDAYPVFLEAGKLDNDPQTKWTLGKAIRYLVWNYNGDEEWVDNPITPDGTSLDTFLQAVSPKDGEEYMDPEDEDSFERSPILLQNVSASGKPWIEVMSGLLERYGFGLFVATDQDDETEEPRNRMIVYRKDGFDGAEPKDVWIPKEGSLLDGLPDANGLSLALDARPVANEWRVETGEVEYEASFILAPLFEIDGGDASNSNSLRAFDRGDPTFAGTNSRKYRWFGVDECGEGHCTKEIQDASDHTPFDFKEVFGEPTGDDGRPKRLFAHRWRPGLMQLATLDTAGKRREATLEISTDYDGPFPAVWDDAYSSTWRLLGTAGWKLLKDRLGIEITADNPNAWKLPKASGSTAGGSAGDVMKLVERFAIGDPNGAEDQRPPIFRLTCTIKSDTCIDALAEKRDSSPGEWKIRRCVEAKDRFRLRIISSTSALNTSKKDIIPPEQDDTDDAKAEAEALRDAHECPPLAGSFGVPWVSHAFGVGDLIGSIAGREIDLARNVGTEAGEGPRYPVIVAFEVACQMPQRTTFQITDRCAETPREYAGE